MFLALVVLAASLFGWLAPVLAQPVPVGPEFLVNPYTTSLQVFPAAAADAAGNFVVVWWGSDGSSVGVFGRRFDSSGVPLGSEFQVNTWTWSSQFEPEVASDAAGNFVVVWTADSGLQHDWDYGVFGQRYDSTGVPSGREFHVNTYTEGHQHRPAVASDAAGNFVVVWQSYKPSGDANFNGIFAQRYDSNGTRLGGCSGSSSTSTGCGPPRSIAARRPPTAYASSSGPS